MFYASTYKQKFYDQYNLDYKGFFHCKNVFPEKIYIVLNPKANTKLQNMLRTLEQPPKFAIILIQRFFELPPLHMQKVLVKIVFGLYIFNRFSKLFVALFKTFGMQRDDKIMFKNKVICKGWCKKSKFLCSQHTFVLFGLMLYIHGKQLRSCWDGQLSYPHRGRLPVLSAYHFAIN